MKNLIFGALIIGFCQIASAGLLDELSDDQRAAVANGQQVYIEQNVEGAPWPKAFIYQRVHATPEEAMATYSDYGRHKMYIPNVKKSSPRPVSARTAHIDYTLNIPVPFVKDENYTNESTLATYDEGASYTADSKQIRADTNKHAEGYVRFETMGTGSVMGYYAFVIPSSGLAKIVKNAAIKQVKDTASAFVTEIERVRTQDPALLQAQLDSLRTALAASEAP